VLRAVELLPPLAPVIITVSPRRTRPRVRTTWTAVPAVQHTVAATVHGMPSGTRPMPPTGATIIPA